MLACIKKKIPSGKNPKGIENDSNGYYETFLPKGKLTTTNLRLRAGELHMNDVIRANRVSYAIQR